MTNLTSSELASTSCLSSKFTYPDDRAVCKCQVESPKIFDKDLGTPLSACIDEIGMRVSRIRTALHNMHRKLYIGGAFEEDPGFKPEVEDSMAASILEIYKILSVCEQTMDEIFEKL